MSTDTRPTLGRHIGRVSVDISAECRSPYRPIVSTDTRPTDALSTHDPNEASSIHGKNIVESFHVDDRHYGMNFVSQITGENYNGIVFTNRFKNASWDVITLEIGIGLAKLLRIESEEMFTKYWSAPDWRLGGGDVSLIGLTG